MTTPSQKKRLFSIFSIILSVLLLTFWACRKDPKPLLADVVDPCAGAKEVKGDFIIEEQTSPYFEKYTISDTVYNGKNVRFSALEEDAEYTWYIGTEVIHTKEVTRYFSDTWAGTNIPITLVTKKKSNKLCFPDDDGYDSITKIMHVSELPDWVSPNVTFGPIEGDFRVKSEHLPDSFDINIDVTITSPTGTVYFNIENYDGFGSSCIQQARPKARNYRQIWGFHGVGTYACDAISGDVHVRMDGIVEMNFSFFHPNNPNFVVRKYLGRKL